MFGEAGLSFAQIFDHTHTGHHANALHLENGDPVEGAHCHGCEVPQGIHQYIHVDDWIALWKLCNYWREKLSTKDF